jgi:hypothetical protein
VAAAQGLADVGDKHFGKASAGLGALAQGVDRRLHRWAVLQLQMAAAQQVVDQVQQL